MHWVKMGKCRIRSHMLMWKYLFTKILVCVRWVKIFPFWYLSRDGNDRVNLSRVQHNSVRFLTWFLLCQHRGLTRYIWQPYLKLNKSLAIPLEMLTASANPLPESSDLTLRGFRVSSSIWTFQDRTCKQEYCWAILP